MKVQLTYFKDTGKYYSEGEYETELDSLTKIWEEVRAMIQQGKCPGLLEGRHDFHTLVNVAGHRHEHPRLMLKGAYAGVVLY
jgi:hypothetical protein